MARRIRHRLLFVLVLGIVASGAAAVGMWPEAWRPVLAATAGSAVVAVVCGRVLRRHLTNTLGRLRRVADDVAEGRPVPILPVRPGDDLYKLNAAINHLALRLAEAREKEEGLREELRRRERLAVLGELAATVAHEVNNPLDGVQNCVRILRRCLDDPVRRSEMLDLVDNGLGRIELIVRRLLTLAREHVVRPAAARLRDVVAGAVQIVAPTLAGRAIYIREHIETENDYALVDAPLLEGVFVNLLRNAADSMPQGGEITVTIRPAADFDAVDGKKAGLCVDVADRGCGIPPDILPHIFEPFFTTKKGGRGTGLGLAIASRIVDAHEGTLSVAARAGGGTVFTVRLPAAEVSSALADAVRAATQPARPGPALQAPRSG